MTLIIRRTKGYVCGVWVNDGRVMMRKEHVVTMTVACLETGLSSASLS